MTGRRVVVAGPGPYFLSGVSYHTAAIVRALQRRSEPVSALLLRQLCPRWLYPGRVRVGAHDLRAVSLEDADVFDGLDWYWLGSLGPALRWMEQRHPSTLLIQWWTTAAAHSYLALARSARRAGAQVVLEMHEARDVGEAQVPLGEAVSRAFSRAIRASVDGVVVHSEADADAMVAAHPALRGLPTQVVFPGPLEHRSHGPGGAPIAAATPAPAAGPVRYLYFGVIRPYKGLDELLTAFEQLPGAPHLTIAGEPWEPGGSLERARALGPERVSVVDRFLADDEVPALFAGADCVVLPYRRASASGPVNLAMAAGLPLVTTDLPALKEATRGYAGAVLARPGDPGDLRSAMGEAAGLAGRRFANPHSWDANAASYLEFFQSLGRS